MASVLNLAVNGSVIFFLFAVALIVALLVLPKRISDRMLANRFIRRFVEYVGNVDLSHRAGGANKA